jgi:two-component system chemotaxis response regulator CheY
MKTLIVEDDFTSRLVLQGFLSPLGPTHIAVNGNEATDAVRSAYEQGEPYDLICLDILMPGKDGQQTLKDIRDNEEARGVSSSRGAKIVMTTSVGDMKSVLAAFKGLCDAYVTKPIDKAKLIGELRKLGLVT